MKLIFFLSIVISLQVRHLDSLNYYYRVRKTSTSPSSIMFDYSRVVSSRTSSFYSFFFTSSSQLFLPLLSHLSLQEDVTNAAIFEQLDPNMLPLIFKYVDACTPAISSSMPESKLQAVLQISKYLSKWSDALSMGVIPDEENTGQFYCRTNHFLYRYISDILSWICIYVNS